MRKIQCKYSEYLVLPQNALTAGCDEYETLDGVRCRLEFIMSCRNERDAYRDELDDICQKHFGCSFSAIRSIWFDRVGATSDYWHLVKLIKL